MAKCACGVCTLNNYAAGQSRKWSIPQGIWWELEQAEHTSVNVPMGKNGRYWIIIRYNDNLLCNSCGKTASPNTILRIPFSDTWKQEYQLMDCQRAYCSGVFVFCFLPQRRREMIWRCIFLQTTLYGTLSRPILWGNLKYHTPCSLVAKDWKFDQLFEKFHSRSWIWAFGNRMMCSWCHLVTGDDIATGKLMSSTSMFQSLIWDRR